MRHSDTTVSATFPRSERARRAGLPAPAANRFPRSRLTNLKVVAQWGALKRMITENEMSPETTIVELDLTPEELAELQRLAEGRKLPLEDLVASAVKKYLASDPKPPADNDLPQNQS